ncbi:hypothetical protein [Streptomyces canus]|uniref:hypothetical protein n=1 Tax=Streptomyces canus TaxID=58343 RepID=UPI000524E98C|nr:hypothetical protein [Streptomyces canus]
MYTLTDPRDGTIRYVGKTTKTLSERLAGHLSSPTNPAMQVWIGTLRMQQLAPVITQIASAPEGRLGALEEKLITQHIHDGHRLFNAPHFAQHVADLVAAAPASPRRRPIRYWVVLPLLGTYLWVVGFDRLARREVFPRLSPAEAPGLFRSYFAQPLLMICVHALVVLAVWALFACLRRRSEAKRSDPARVAAAAAQALTDAIPPRSA